jgi:hypothetical protein
VEAEVEADDPPLLLPWLLATVARLAVLVRSDILKETAISTKEYNVVSLMTAIAYSGSAVRQYLFCVGRIF